jgi:hypothetical protein
MLIEWIAQSIAAAQIWYAVPLVIVISLVYGATRHEQMAEILKQAGRSAVWVTVFMTIIFAIVWLAGYGVS